MAAIVAAVAGGSTAFANPAATGTVTYSGYMQLIMGNEIVSANVIGDVSLQVDFTDATLSGAADGFLGVTTDEAMIRQVVSYEGTIAISGGQIVEGDAGSADVSFLVNGDLDNGMTTFDIDGQLVGGINGANAEGLYAIGSNTGVHGSMDTVIDGVSGPTNIGIGTVSAVRQ